MDNNSRLSIGYDEFRQALLTSMQGHNDKVLGGAVHTLSETYHGARDLTDLKDTYPNQALALNIWSDFLREGILSLAERITVDSGDNRQTLMHFVLTSRGAELSAQPSTSPYNAEGYLAAIRPFVEHNEVAMSFITEAIAVFRAGFGRAAAVLLGISSECLIIEVAHHMESALSGLSDEDRKRLNDKSIKTVADAIHTVLGADRSILTRRQRDRLSSIWPYLHSIRLSRNAIGHPSEISAVAVEMVHGNLIQFHNVVRLMAELRQALSGVSTDQVNTNKVT